MYTYNQLYILYIHQVTQFSGIFSVKVQQLVPPKWTNAVRKLNENHVKNIKQAMLTKPYGAFNMIVVNVTNFSISNLERLKLEVIGGNHTRQALQELLEEGRCFHLLYFKYISAYI